MIMDFPLFSVKIFLNSCLWYDEKIRRKRKRPEYGDRKIPIRCRMVCQTPFLFKNLRTRKKLSFTEERTLLTYEFLHNVFVLQETACSDPTLLVEYHVRFRLAMRRRSSLVRTPDSRVPQNRATQLVSRAK